MINLATMPSPADGNSFTLATQVKEPKMNRMIPNVRWAALTICSLSIAMLGSSCPSTVPIPGPGPLPKVATITSLGVATNGRVAAGNGIIAFGNDSGGVSYINVGGSTVTDIPGSFRTDAVFCAGRKIILVADGATNSISVHDTTTGITVNVPDTNVFDINPNSNLEQRFIDVDGNLCAILDSASGTRLKLIDVSPATPVVTTFSATLFAPTNVDLDVASGKIVVSEFERYITIFDTSLPANQTPTTFDLVTDAGITVSFLSNAVTSNEHVLFMSDGQIVKLLDVTDGNLDDLAIPASANFFTHLEIRAGLFVYFLGRTDPDDVDFFAGNRVLIGNVSDPATLELGTGASLGDGIRQGFGLSSAIAPNGLTVYLAGRTYRFTGLQFFDVSNGWGVFTDSNGDPVYSSDVNASSSVVAFKVKEGNGAVLGYYLP